MLPILESLRSSARTRLYIFRLLLALNVVLLVLCSLGLDVSGIVILVLTLFHQIFVLFKPAPKIVDIVLILGEIASVAVGAFLFLPVPVPVAWLDFIALCFMLFFRATDPKPRGGSELGFFCGRELYAHYTPWRIIFGFHPWNYFPILKPLVKEESLIIIGIRSVILIALCVLIPAFGIYTVFIVPISSKAIIRDVKISQSWTRENPWFGFTPSASYLNITIILSYVDTSGVFFEPFNVTATQGCPATNVTIAHTPFTAVTCSFPWWAAPSSGIVISANFTDPWGVLYVKAGEGNPIDVDAYTEPIPLVAGARLMAILSSTQRKVFSNSALDLLGFTTPLRTVMLKSVLLLQDDPSPSTQTSNTVVLRLRPRLDLPFTARVVEDFTDASVLSGFSNAGGFWSFINDLFGILFGANLLYFLLGKRPFSVLGMVHIFQRKTLEGEIDNVNTDPGVITFIRKRLIDGARNADPDNTHEAAGGNPIYGTLSGREAE
ncbi:Short-chain dehydrogenase/reductase family protein [Mycena sanguinolenta]|uniref:Short-chain dehydrogenase/reductase family protein n=1 Tax=Mycena sanguinolenta TaxID=230812 RepID=A0A8H7DA30_9AGAR|nr:Short-chain dehydrogenase/reductase family protein [Mycena sanguinolenta]